MAIEPGRPAANVPEEWIRIAPPPRPLTGDDLYTVFLSYRSANRPWVVNLYDVLRRFGHTVFLDQCVLVAGQRLTRTLEEGLGRSQAAVLNWSRAAGDSEWVRNEYEAMLAFSQSKKGFQFVPVRLDDAPLPLFAAGRLFLDFQAYPDGPNGGELLRLLHGVVGQPLSDEAVRFAVQQDQASAEAFARVGAARKVGDVRRLLELYREGGMPWRASAALACKTAQALTDLGADDQAFGIVDEIVANFPRAIRPKHLKALTLHRRARAGGTSAQAEDDIRAAQLILAELVEQNERDPETLGLYGATWMERYERSGSLLDLRHSRDLYLEAFTNARDDYYVGLNAAAKSVLLGTPAEIEKGRSLAREVQEIVASSQPAGDQYWRAATRAECQLILGAVPAAAALYQEAVAAAHTLKGAHESTWLQACRLMRVLQPGASERELVRQAFAHLPDCRP